MSSFSMTNSYHVFMGSPWPVYLSINLFSLTVSFILSLSFEANYLLFQMIFMASILTVGGWMRDVTRESFLMGEHDSVVLVSARLGAVLFILSEVMFFSSIFWGFLWMSNQESMLLGMTWPPTGLMLMDPYGLPFLNTVILVSSGFTATWAHHSIMCSDLKEFLAGYEMTLFLGAFFTLIQMYEYKMASFSFSDSSFGSIFFLSTGFHGLHVFLGFVCMNVMLTRFAGAQFSTSHYLGVEVSLWYWHFVDVVWMFLFFLVYLGPISSHTPM